MKIICLVCAAAVVFAAGLMSASAQTSPPAVQANPVAPPGSPAGSTASPEPTAASNPGSSPADVTAPKPLPFSPQRQCVDSKDFAIELGSGRRPVGDTVVLETNVLPTGQRVDVGIRTPYVDGSRYFAALERDDGRVHILDRQDVVTRRAVAADSLVKSKLLDADQTIVSLDMYSEDAGFWRKSDMYLYTCGTNGSPARVSRINIRLSSHTYSLWFTGITLLILYGLLAWALGKHERTFQSFMVALNPVKLTSGPDGKGSLAKFQVLSFSLLVFALMLLFVLETGMLTDLSMTILTLLGINGIGATLAKGADNSRNTLASDNRAWLMRRGWLPAAKAPVDNSNAAWRDFFSTDGEFDVYRYQSLIFSLIVGGALVFAGVTQLSTFSIPDTVLGIVGLSQAVYIGGKLVTRTGMADLNDAIADLRGRERKLRDSAVLLNNGAPIASLAQGAQLSGPAYAAYMDKARDVGTLFTAETGLPLAPAALEPFFTT